MRTRGSDTAPSFLEAQAARLAPLRSSLLRRVHIGRARRALEIGCGTGAITAELRRRCPGLVVALDLSLDAVADTHERVPTSEVCCGHGCRLPFCDRAFDVVAFSFTLMWADDPMAFVSEAARVTRSGGHVVALAEPDYGAYDETPEILGSAICQGITAMGGTPDVGALLCELFSSVRLQTEAGHLGSGAPCAETTGELTEMCAIASQAVGDDEGRRMASRVRAAQADGLRRAVVPVHWAIGRKR